MKWSTDGPDYVLENPWCFCRIRPFGIGFNLYGSDVPDALYFPTLPLAKEYAEDLMREQDMISYKLTEDSAHVYVRGQDVLHFEGWGPQLIAEAVCCLEDLKSIAKVSYTPVVGDKGIVSLFCKVPVAVRILDHMYSSAYMSFLFGGFITSIDQLITELQELAYAKTLPMAEDIIP